MPIWLRRFTFNSLNEFYLAEQEEYKKARTHLVKVLVSKGNTPEEAERMVSEMEKKVAKMEEIGKAKEEEIKGKPAEDKKEADIKMEEDLPKLDGAPIDENASKGQNIKMSKKDKVVNSQSNFLSKLYK